MTAQLPQRHLLVDVENVHAVVRLNFIVWQAWGGESHLTTCLPWMRLTLGSEENDHATEEVERRCLPGMSQEMSESMLKKHPASHLLTIKALEEG